MTTSSAITGAYRATRHPRVAWVELDGEVVVYQEVSAYTFVLNPTGSTIWQLFDGSHSLSEIASELAAAYGADPDLVENDVLLVARDLGDRGLLADVEPTDPGDAATSHG